MNRSKKTIIFCLSIIIIYTLGILFFGYKNDTIKNTKLHVELTEKPRLEDNFYNYINYDKLSKVLVDESKAADTWSYISSYTETLEEEKKKIIDDIVSKCDTYPSDSVNKKLCTYYESLKNINYNENKKVLDEYIDLINSSKNIAEYQKNIATVNNKLYDANILFSLTYGIKDDDFAKKYPTISYMYYDYLDDSNYYNLALLYDNGEKRSILKKSDLKLLMEYGYSEEDARRVVANIYDMFATIAKYSSLTRDEKEAKLYTIEELSHKYSNINFDLIKSELDNRFGTSTNILVGDDTQLKLINNYLVDENLQTLKEYALVRLLYTYGYTINENMYTIAKKLDNLKNGISEDKKINKEDMIYEDISEVFNDTIAIEFAKKYSYDKLKPYYKNLIDTYLEEYRKRINRESWLGKETKANAIKKIDRMGVNVLYPDTDKSIYYNLTGNNIYEIGSNLSKSYDKYVFDNIEKYNIITNNWLEVNAFYAPYSNYMVLEMGYVYAFNDAMSIDINNIDDYYYETLGGIGFTVGHELSHGFDNSGSKFDEFGKENDWWTEEDKIAYNKLNLKVEKYYDKLGQDGYQTLGENIADLGAMALTIQIAESKNAIKNDYKKIFESIAEFEVWQSSHYMKGWLLLNEEHSPSENRINGVYSSTDKFYEVYDIKKGDKMYVAPEDRVSVW